jgi:hypothetical protein
VAPVAPGSLEHAHDDPEACAHWLSNGADLWGIEVEVLDAAGPVTAFEVVFSPPPAMADYPDERVIIALRSDQAIASVPVGPTRTWEHRFPRYTVDDILRYGSQKLAWKSLLGGLCLWYPQDPEHLKWTWSDGLDAYLRIVQRHVWLEEHFRRHGVWVGEDVPHGERDDGQPHPILTPELRRAS